MSAEQDQIHERQHSHHTRERVEVEVLTTKNLKPINDAHRFALYSIGCFAALVVSFGYAFNLISSDMQKLLNLSMTDLADINTVGTCLQYGSFFYSIIFDWIGPIVPLAIGAVTFAVGAITLALAFRGSIRPTLVRLCVFNGIMNLSLIAFDLASNVTITAHFPTARGLMIPLLKSYVGLGSAIVGTLQLAFFTNPEYFFYFLTALAVVVAVLMIIFVKLPKYHMTIYQMKHLSEEEKAERTASKAQYLRQKPATWRFIYSFVILGVLIVFLPVQSAVLAYDNLGKSYKIGFAITTIILVLLLTLVSIPVPSDRKLQKKTPEEHFDEQNSQEDEGEGNRVEDVAEIEDKGSEAEFPDDTPKETIIDYIAPQYPFTFVQSLATLRYWCFFWTLFCLGGVELTVISYSSYIYGTKSGAPVDANMRTLLSVLNGVGSAIGRLIIALFEHLTQHRPPEKRIPMTWAPFIPASFSLITVILFLALPAKPLPLAFVLLAIANGAQAAMTALVPRTIYANDVAKHYQFLFLANVISPVVLVRFLFAEWYARQAKHNGNTGGYCYGKRCIIMPFCVMLGLVCTTFFSSLYLCWRYWQFCNKVLAERARLREEAMAGDEGHEGDVENIEELIQGTNKDIPDGVDDLVQDAAKKIPESVQENEVSEANAENTQN